MRASGAVLVGMALMAALSGCERGEREPVLPAPDSVAAWFGAGTEARLSGNVLEIRGTMDPEFLRRGGSLWAQSGPFFYLFTVRVRDLLVDYPDLAAVRAVTLTPAGEEVARATLASRGLNEYEWREALALASLAQTEGTDNLRRIDALIRFGEEKTEYRYARD